MTQGLAADLHFHLGRGSVHSFIMNATITDNILQSKHQPVHIQYLQPNWSDANRLVISLVGMMR